jgi:hypothetical protein
MGGPKGERYSPVATRSPTRRADKIHLLSRLGGFSLLALARWLRLEAGPGGKLFSVSVMGFRTPS